MKQKILLAVLITATLFASCKQEILPPDISGVETTEYLLNIGDKITLAPNVTNLKGNSYEWTLNGKKIPDALYDYEFIAREPGTFIVLFKAENKGGKAEQAFKIVVEAPIEISFDKPIYVIPKCKLLKISPKITGPERDDYQYEWTLGETVIGKEKDIDFIQAKPGDYELQLKAFAGKQTETTTCNVKVEEAKYSSRATSILSYETAANTHWYLTNTGKQPEDYILSYNEFMETISEEMKGTNIPAINIGNWGSYVIVGFDHTIVNVEGRNDIEIRNGKHIPNALGFYVAYDKNRNGKPDEDEWYLIKHPLDLEDYERTFTFIGKPEFETSGKFRFCTITYEVKDSKGVTEERTSRTSVYDHATPLDFPGYYIENEEIAMKEGWKTSYTLKGKMTSLPQPNYSGNKTLSIDIDNAIDKNGNHVTLPGIDFVKIQQIAIINHQDITKGEVSNLNEIAYVRDMNL